MMRWMGEWERVAATKRPGGELEVVGPKAG